MAMASTHRQPHCEPSTGHSRNEYSTWEGESHIKKVRLKMRKLAGARIERNANGKNYVNNMIKKRDNFKYKMITYKESQAQNENVGGSEK